MNFDQLGGRVTSAKSPKERWNAIRALYDALNPIILAAPPNQWAIDPYVTDWLKIMTPIEYGIWIDIRGHGVVLYPQYPVGRFFADFANPVARVVIECDGRAFHRDQDRDERRQAEIEAAGWSVYRIEGWQCLEPDEEWDEDLVEYVKNPKAAGAIIAEIAVRHGIRKVPSGSHS